MTRSARLVLTLLVLELVNVFGETPCPAELRDHDAPHERAELQTTVYDETPKHLWNRLHDVLFVRRGPDGKSYGRDRLEPLLWPGSKRLLEKGSHERAVAVLDEFIAEHGEKLVRDPIKRAMLQRDIWLVVNWLNGEHLIEWNSDPKLTPDAVELAKERLLARLSSVVHRIALSPDEIRKLPDNYAAAVAANQFAKQFNSETPDVPFLPPDLFAQDGPWICVGDPAGPVAPEHLREDGTNRFTNSAFLVFLRLPDGRAATMEFLKQLRDFDQPLFVRVDNNQNRSGPSPNPNLPQFPTGTQVALVRQALLIDTSHRIAASSLTESVQLRVYREIPPMTRETLDGALTSGTEANRRAQDWQAFYEFRLSRKELFSRRAGGLIAVGSDEPDFKTGFGAHPWDEFERQVADNRPFAEVSRQLVLKQSCFACHSLPGVYSLNSHFNFRTSNWRNLRIEKHGLPRPARLRQITIADVRTRAVKWKESQTSWETLIQSWKHRGGDF